MPARSTASATITPVPKREAILRAALLVFAEHGVHSVPVPEIAARAGVGTGTIYRFFVSKEALINELYREQKRAFRERVLENFDRKAEPRTLFREYWKRLVAFAREQPEAFRFLELQDHLPHLDAESRALEYRVLGPVADASRRLQKQGIYRKDLRVEVIMALHWGAFVNLFKAERGGYLKLKPADIEAACDACWRMCAVESK
ncbi:MAG: TetR/AcrR family transcriptional regulator [Polyangiales bacterium]